MAIVVRNVNNSANESISIYREDGSSQRLSRCEDVHFTEEIPVDESIYNLDVLFDVTKSSDEGLVSGWANIALEKDGKPPLDWQGDIIRPEVLEKAAINFMLDYRESGVMHKGDATGVIVESIVFTKEKQESLGISEGTIPEGWFITVKVLDDEVFALVKAGAYKMFSIQGRAKRCKL